MKHTDFFSIQQLNFESAHPKKCMTASIHQLEAKRSLKRSREHEFEKAKHSAPISPPKPA